MGKAQEMTRQAKKEVKIKDEEVSMVLDACAQEVEEVEQQMTRLEKDVQSKINKAVKENSLVFSATVKSAKEGEQLAFSKMIEATTKVDDLKSELVKAKSKMQRLEATLAEKDCLDKDKQEAENTVASLSQVLTNSNAKESKLQSDVKKLQKKLKDQERSNKSNMKSQLASQLSMWKHNIKEHQDKHEKIQQKMEQALESAKDDLCNAIAQYEKKFEDFKSSPNTIILPAH